jgi:uncharacterized cupredoxin-like copper-binding protein
MTRYPLLLVAAFLVLVAVPVAQARPTRTATTVTVTEGKPTEFKFTLSVKTVKHGAVTFKITNKGALGHDFKVCTAPVKTAAKNACAGKGTGVLTSGSSMLKVTFAKAGTYEYLCSVAGHAAAGMKGTFLGR